MGEGRVMDGVSGTGFMDAIDGSGCNVSWRWRIDSTNEAILDFGEDPSADDGVGDKDKGSRS